MADHCRDSMSEDFTNENCSALSLDDDSIALLFCNDTVISTTCFNACHLLLCEENNATLFGEDSNSAFDTFINISIKILTFLLLAGFAATVDARVFFENFKSKGVYLGLFSQFIVMPFLGLLSVLLFYTQLDDLLSIMILIITACPGGAYSNWFCSVFNADLSLSVAMTTTSTLLASVLLPLNVFIHLQLFGLIAGSSDEELGAGSLVSQLPYGSLFATLGVVICGVISGLLFGYFLGSKWQHRANMAGNVAGIVLQVFAVFASSTSCSPPWEQSPLFLLQRRFLCF